MHRSLPIILLAFPTLTGCTKTGGVTVDPLLNPVSPIKAEFSAKDPRSVFILGRAGSLGLWALNPDGMFEKKRSLSEVVANDAAFMDADLIAVATPAGHLAIVNGRTGNVRLSAKKHDGPANRVAVSSSGQVIVTAGGDRMLRRWDAEGNQVGEPVEADKQAVTALAISPTGHRVATAGQEPLVHILDGDKLRPLFELKGHTATIQSLTFSPASEHIASGSADGTVRVWSKDGALAGKPLKHGGVVTAVAFSPDGRLLLSGGADGVVRIWDLKDFTQRGDPIIACDEAIHSLSFALTGEVFVSVGGDEAVRAWKLSASPTGNVFRLDYFPDARINSLDVDRDANLLVSGGEDQTFRLWEVAAGVPSGKTFAVKTPAAVNSVVLIPNSLDIAIGCDGGEVILYKGGKPVALSQMGYTVHQLAVSPDGDTLIAAAANNILRAWKVADHSELPQITVGDRDASIHAVQFLGDGSTVAVGLSNGTIHRVNIKKRATIGSPLEWHQGPVMGLAVSAGRHLLASVGRDGLLRIGNTDGTPYCDPTLAHDGQPIWSVAFSPSGNYLATAGCDDGVRLWRVGDRQCTLQKVLRGHRGWVYCATFAAGKDVLMTAGSDGAIRVWDAEGRPVGAPLKGHRPANRSKSNTGFDIFQSMFEDESSASPINWRDLVGRRAGKSREWGEAQHKIADEAPLNEYSFKGGIRRLAMSSDGRYLAALGQDAALRVWTVAGGEDVCPPVKVTEWKAEALAFAPSAEAIYTADFDGSVRTWDYKGRPLSSPLFLHRGAVRALSVRPDGRALATGGRDGTVHIVRAERGAMDCAADGASSVGLIGWPPGPGLLHAASAILLGRVRVLASAADAHKDGVSAVCYIGAGKTLASGGKDGRITLWDTSVGLKAIRSFPAHTRGVNCLTASPAMDLIGSAGGDGKIRIWDAGGNPRTEEFGAEGSPAVSLAFSRRGDLLISCHVDGRIRFWNMSGALGGEVQATDEGSAPAIAVSPKEDLFASTVAGGKVQTWSLNAARHGTPLQPANNVKSLALSAKDAIFAWGGRDRALRLVRFDGTPVCEPLKHDARVMEGAFASTETGNVLFFNEGWVRAVTFSPEGYLASGGDDGKIRFWEPDGAPRQHSLAIPDDPLTILKLRFSPTGGQLAASTFTRKVYLWELPEGKNVKTLKGHPSQVTTISFVPVGKTVVTSDGAGVAASWALDPEPKPTQLPTKGITCMAASETQALVAFAVKDGTVVLAKPDGKDSGHNLKGHSGRVMALAFSADSKLLLSAGADFTLRVWDVALRRQLHEARLTMTPLDVGFWKSRVWVRGNGDLLGFFDAELHLMATVVISPTGVLAYNNDGLYCGSGDLVRDVKVYDKAGTRLRQADIFARYSADRVLESMTGERSRMRRLCSHVVATYKSVEAWYASLPAWAKAIFWPSLVYASLIALIALTWLVRPATLTALAMKSAAIPEPKEHLTLKAWDLLLQTAAFVKWFGASQRSLDGWLRRHLRELHERCFEGNDGVKKRSMYADLGNQGDIDAFLAGVSGDSFAPLWITGLGGGSGKSTLAFRMAKLGSSGAGRPPILPVVIDTGWEKGKLRDLLAVMLKVGERTLTDSMVEKLCRRGRLILVLDGLSEMKLRASGDGDKVEDDVADYVRASAFKLLIVTSRKPPSSRDFKEVQVGALDDTRMGSFVAEYTKDNPGMAEDITRALREFSRGKPMRPMFARLAIERCLEAKRLPTSYLGLVKEYLSGVRPKGPGALREGDFLRAASVVANACLDNPDLSPGPQIEDFLRGCLKAAANEVEFVDEDAGEVPVEKVLDQLVQCGLLVRVGEPGTLRVLVRFAEDPIAEYIMAMHMTTQDARKINGFKRRRSWLGSGLAEAYDETTVAP